MSTQVRDALPSDADAIKNIYIKVIQNKSDTLYNFVEEITDEFILEKINYGNNGTALVILKNDIITGFACGKIVDSRRKRHIVENPTIIVDPEYQKTNIGIRLSIACFESVMMKHPHVRYVYTYHFAKNNKTPKLQKLLTYNKYTMEKWVLKNSIYHEDGELGDVIMSIIDLHAKPSKKKKIIHHIFLLFCLPITYISTQIIFRYKNKVLDFVKQSVKLY